jgi:hypothetical protein
MKYESIEFHGEPAAEAAILRDDPAELLYVPVAASLYSENMEWAQGVCLRLAAHPHFNVRGNAILGIAHLARRFGQLDRARVEPILRSAQLDPDPYVTGHAYDAIDDVRHFLGWDLSALAN